MDDEDAGAVPNSARDGQLRRLGLRRLGNCPRCEGAVLAGTCLNCGWEPGPAALAANGDRRRPRTGGIWL